jgi:hypothetical protein
MMPPFYPRKKRQDICDEEDPRIMCSTRRMEVLDGAFGWDSRREGYYSTRLPGPWGIPVLLDACCFCNTLLPGAKARKRFEAKLDAEKPKQLKAPEPIEPPKERGINSGDATAYLDDEDGN